MIEFLLPFLVTLALMSGFVLLQSRLRVPRYRLEREDLRALLEDALAGRARIERWDLIIGMPVRHDEKLEQWRARLATLAEQGRPGCRNRDGVKYCHFLRAEQELLSRILQEMKFAESGPANRAF